MENNSFLKMFNSLKKLLIYSPPKDPSRFVLKETNCEKKQQPPVPDENNDAKLAIERLAASIRYGKRLITISDNIIKLIRTGKATSQLSYLKAQYVSLERQSAEQDPLGLSYDSHLANLSQRRISASLAENETIISNLYDRDKNKDLIIRHITIPGQPPLRAMLILVDGMVDSKIINLSVLQPLMLPAYNTNNGWEEDLLKQIYEERLPANQVHRATLFEGVEEGVNSGDTAIFIEGVPEVLLVGTKGWEHRGVDVPSTEQTVRGSQAAFSENIRVNTALIRTMLRSTDLITEMIKIGKRSRINCAVMYVKSVANPDLVSEVKRRLEGISTDYIADSGMLEQFIQDDNILPLPQSLSTERPDRVASHLSEGRVAIILEGTPFAHVVPASFFTLFHAGEDFSFPMPAANFLRILRFFGALLSMILPAFFIAITYYHQEALPTELVLAIAASHENVPFPVLFEVLAMEISFELIREAGVRIPGVLGSTIGIVGAIILGQAGVSAHIVSPITVIVVAITGLAASIVPEYRMAFLARISRFFYMVLAASMGLVGLACGLWLSSVALCSMKSFGIPYLVPIGPKTSAGYDVVMRGPIYRQEERPDDLNTQDQTRQPHISRKWIKEPPTGGNT